MRTLSLDVRPERPQDRDAVAEVVAAAFGDPAVVELVDRVRASPGYVPRWSLVAEAGDRVVGHVMVSRTSLRPDDATAPDLPVVTLSPLGVVPAWQRRGVGRALVEAAVAAVDADGEPLVTVEGSPAYYGRLGFEPAAEHGIAMHLPDWAPPAAAQVRRLRAYRPGLRGTLVYPPAFDEVVGH